MTGVEGDAGNTGSTVREAEVVNPNHLPLHPGDHASVKEQLDREHDEEEVSDGGDDVKDG